MHNISWKLFTHSIPSWEAMLSDLKNAKRTIDIEHYIFANDEIGKKFIDVLKDKAKEGIKVRLLVDMVGSLSFYNSKTPKELEELGAEVKFFNTVKPWRTLRWTSWFLRDHRKIIVIDTEVAYTGGLGMRKNMLHWRDTNARIEGDVVHEIESSFNEMWRRADEHGFIKKIKRLRKQKRRFYFITNDPYFRRRFLYYTFVNIFRSAKKYIYITTPYFIPDRRMSRVLRLASKRGVDVKVLIPEKLDVPIIELASNSTLGKLIKDGVRIYKYQPEFIHAKTAVVDGEWSTIGSFNMDTLSFLYNHEANVVTPDSKCANDIKELFLADLKNSKEIKFHEWDNRLFLYKFIEFLAGLIKGIL